MATIRALSGAMGRRHQAIVRKSGFSLSRVFPKVSDARAWAVQVEAAIANASHDRPFNPALWLPVMNARASEDVDSPTPHPAWNIGQALAHYAETISVRKKGATQEVAKISVLRKSGLAEIRLDKLTQDDVQGYVEELEKAGLAGATIRLRIMVLRSLYRDARSLWRLELSNHPCQGLRMPPLAAHRNRRFQDGNEDEKSEEERLRGVLATKPAGPIMLDLLDLAIETGMRQAVLLSITAGQLRRVDGVDTIEQPDSKNGQPRHVVLSTKAATILKRHAKGKTPYERLFPWKPEGLRQRWNAAKKAAGLTNLRWHDLRHEALSRMGAKGMHVGMLMGQSGHRTVSTLKRYLNPTPKEVKKLLG